MDNVIYNYDRIKIYFKISKDTLRNTISPHFEAEYKIQHTSHMMKQHGFNALIDIIWPSKEFLAYLSSLKISTSLYSIGYLEIAKDIFANDKTEAIKMFIEYEKTRYALWKNNFLFDATKTNTKKNSRFFYDRTLYFQINKTSNSIVAVYPCYSKSNPYRACLHHEFRLKKAGIIKKQIKINTLKELYIANLENVYNSLANKYIRQGTINHRALGKYFFASELFGLKRKFTKRELQRIGLRATCLLKDYDIKTPADLKTWLSQQRKIIKRKPGRKTTIEKKIMNAKSIDRFIAK